MQTKEVDGLRLSYKMDRKGRMYIYDHQIIRHYTFNTDLPVWAICKYCGTKIGSPAHFCPRCGKDIDRQYAGEK